MAKRSKSIKKDASSPHTHGAYQGDISQGKISDVDTNMFKDKKNKSNS